MSDLSRKCELSQMYTNRCIRATGTTILSKSKYNSVQIMTMTGHNKSVSSLAIYQKVSDEEKLEMGSSLGQFLADSSNQNKFQTNNSENFEDLQLDNWNLDVDFFANKTPINNNNTTNVKNTV